MTMTDYQSELMEAATEIHMRCGTHGTMTTRMHPADYAALLKEVYSLRASFASGPPELGVEMPLLMECSTGRMTILVDETLREGQFYMRYDNGGGSTTASFKSAELDATKLTPIALALERDDAKRANFGTPWGQTAEVPLTFAERFQKFTEGEDDD